MPSGQLVDLVSDLLQRFRYYGTVALRPVPELSSQRRECVVDLFGYFCTGFLVVSRGCVGLQQEKMVVLQL